MEKIAELKFRFGEALNSNKRFYKFPYLIYFYAFLMLFAFGIGYGLLRNNFNKSLQKKEKIDSSLINQNKSDFKKDVNKKDIEKPNMILSEKIDNFSFTEKQITNASPTLNQIKYLINTWLFNKSNFLAGKSEISISKIVQNGLIDRLTEERQSDIQKGIYKNITTNIENIELLTQSASRISVGVELKYSEKIFKTDGELVNETTYTPFLKVKYILGFSDKSWKLVDYISGL